MDRSVRDQIDQRVIDLYDDFTHALGDPSEARLAAALSYRAGAACPAPSGLAPGGRLAHALAAVDGAVIKSPFLTNRILPH